MDSSAQNNNQDTVGIDMDAINAAVEASVGQPVAETSFDVDKISLDNTPTTNDELQQQLRENPGMSLAGGPSNTQSGSTNGTASIPATPAPDSVANTGSYADASSENIKPAEDEDFVINSETATSKSMAAISDSAAKMQDNAMKALNAVKPKDSKGVIIVAAVGAAILLIIAIILLVVVL